MNVEAIKSVFQRIFRLSDAELAVLFPLVKADMSSVFHLPDTLRLRHIRYHSDPLQLTPQEWQIIRKVLDRLAKKHVANALLQQAIRNGYQAVDEGRVLIG